MDFPLSTLRLQRNEAEKQRRDRLNGYISRLSDLVPMVKNASKPVDKVSVLRLAAAHMRLNLSCLNPKNFKSKIQTLPSSVTSYLELIEKSVGGFVVVTTFTGTILFCSESIEDYIGYQSINIVGQTIYNFVNSKEIAFFERKISYAILRSKKGKNSTKVIKLHLQQRPLPRSVKVRYRKMIFKISVHSNETNNQLSNSKSYQKSRKVKYKDFDTSSVLLMFIEPLEMQPKINRTFLLTHPDIYFTVHGLQGEIMYADQRIATITGYMPREVQGISAYQYILDTDVPIALFAQKAMFTSNDGMGLITYRLRIIDSTYIYLQSKGQIVYKGKTTEMSHFICLNRRLSDEEGKRELTKFQERFAPQISDSQTKYRQLDNNSPSSNAAEQNSEESISCLRDSNGPYLVEQVSSFPYSVNASLSQEFFVKSNQPESSPDTSATMSKDSIEYMKDFSKCKDIDRVLSEGIIQNHVLRSSLPNSNISPELDFLGEIQQTTYQSGSTTYLSEPCLVQKQFPALQTSAPSFSQHCIEDRSQLLNGSKRFTGTSMSKECFSVAPQDFNQFTNEQFPRFANDSKFNLRENSLHFNCEDLNSNLNSIYPTDEILSFPEAPNNDRFSASELSTFLQSNSSIKKPISGVCWGKDTLLNACGISVKELNSLETDCNLSQKTKTPNLNDGILANSDRTSVNRISSFTQSHSSPDGSSYVFCSRKDKLMNGDSLNAVELTHLDTITKPIVMEESAVYSAGFYSNKSATSGFEYDGLYGVNPSYTITENCLYQKFPSDKFYSNDNNFGTFDGASYRNRAHFGTSYGVRKHCDATFSTPHGVSSQSSSTDYSISNDFSNGRYCSNSINAPNKGFVTTNWSSHSEMHGLQKAIGSRNMSSSSVNDSSSYPVRANPGKRTKNEIISTAHRMNKDCVNLLPDTVLDNALGQSKHSSNVVTKTLTQTDSTNSSFNGELFNELEIFF